MSLLPIPPSAPTPTPRTDDVEVRGCVGCGGPGCLGCAIPFGTVLVLLVSLAVSWWSGPRDNERPGQAPVVAVALASTTVAQAGAARSLAGPGR